MASDCLELHYHLLDGSHSMDAFVRNKCEAELLALVRHVAGELGVGIFIESEAFGEGGLREVWKFLRDSKNANAIVAIGAPTSVMLVLIQILIAILALPPSPDKEQEGLTKELTKLSIEEKKLQLQKLRKELEQGNAPDGVADRAAKQFSDDYKVVTRRSNFYKELLAYPKVTAVGFGYIPPNAAAPQLEKLTDRSEFSRFVIHTDKLPEVVDEQALIEIVAPVITGGNMHWKGVYGGEVISFAMRDKAYKDAVSSRRESFQHGDAILCVLHTERKLDPIGEVVVTGHYVSLVYEKRGAVGVVSTAQGRKKRFEDKHADAQGNLLLTPRE